jgi:uncharacterized protein YecE (DUF72 family)
MSKPRGTSAPKTKTVARSAAREPRRTLSPDKTKHAVTAALRVGTSGWHYEDWRGPFYPADMSPKDFLSFYVEHFNTMEINNSFYHLPTEKAVKAWHDTAPEGFIFAWKVSRFITHIKRLRDVKDSVELVFGRMEGLRHAFGPALFQLPPSFAAKPENKDRLVQCLGLLPKDRSCVFEFRHDSWFDDETFHLLSDHNVAFCISDHVDAPSPWVATADFVYVRGHGIQGHYTGRYNGQTLRDWSRSIAEFRREGRDVYVYFDNDVKAAAPKDADTLIALSRKED